jgi:addiction module RelE/StbE family toxin
MKEIRYTSQFIRSYKQRIARDERLKKDLREGVDSFLEDRSLVYDHALRNAMQGQRAFSINSEYRVVYIERDETFLFLNVGTHQQVYYSS